MGGHDSRRSYYPTSPSPEREPADPLVSACGIIACCDVYENKASPKELVAKLKSDHKQIYTRLHSGTGGMSCIDIRDVFSVLQELISDEPIHYDCRYCSQRRWLGEDLPLPVGARGIVALKFNEGIDTHWVAFDGITKGSRKEPTRLVSDDFFMRNRKEIVEEFPDFDGLGHRIIIWDDYMYNVISHTYSVECQGKRNPAICTNCMRSDFCKGIPKQLLKYDCTCDIDNAGSNKAEQFLRCIDI